VFEISEDAYPACISDATGFLHVISGMNCEENILLLLMLFVRLRKSIKRKIWTRACITKY
jgi:hypothetical protein